MQMSDSWAAAFVCVSESWNKHKPGCGRSFPQLEPPAGGSGDGLGNLLEHFEKACPSVGPFHSTTHCRWHDCVRQ